MTHEEQLYQKDLIIQKLEQENNLLKSIVKQDHPEIGKVKHFESGLEVILDKCVESKEHENKILKEALKLASEYLEYDHSTCDFCEYSLPHYKCKLGDNLCKVGKEPNFSVNQIIRYFIEQAKENIE